MKTNKTAIILLSGGLDSLVALDMAKKDYDIKLALTFDYNQKAFIQEEKAAKEICKFYNIEQKTIILPFLKEIVNNALTDSNNNNFNDLSQVWVANRNGLFLNIAACFADKFKYDYIIFGANKEEAVDFSDNSEAFVNLNNEYFKYSTLNNIKVLAPTLQLDKIQIINYAIDNNVPLHLIKSCYTDSKKHCSQCMSCKHLYNAILKSKKPSLIKELF